MVDGWIGRGVMHCDWRLKRACDHELPLVAYDTDWMGCL